MTFLHPWAVAVGAAAAGLPLLIHWLTRPRPARRPLSTVRFVREVVRQRRARSRLRDLLVLGARVAAVLLLAWAVARPLLGEEPAVTAAAAGDTARVVLLDVSQSMAAESNGVALLERARPLAAEYLGDRPGLGANLLLAGASARPVFDRLSGNFAALRDELAQARPRPERLNVQAAVGRAGELLAGARGGPGLRRELVIVSDFQRSGWAAVDFAALPLDTRVQLVSVAPADPLPNLAVLRAGVRGRAEQGRAARLEVEVGNFSPAARPVEVELTLGDATYRVQGVCAAWAKITLGTDVPLRQGGWQSGQARLLGVRDALAADNSRPFVVEVRPAPIYALLTREAAGPRISSSYFLERALVPAEPRAGRPEARVVRVAPDPLDRDVLAAADVIVVDHPGRLSADAVRLLATLLRRGRGVFYVAAELADAVNLKLLAEAAGSELQLPVEFLPPRAGQPRRDLFLTEVKRDAPPFRVFGDGLNGLTAPLRFAGGLGSRRLEGALADDILASYSDRSACLVLTACGAGTLAVLNADLASSDLPRSPAFVPLVGELVDRLLGPQRGGEAAACGEPLAVSLPPGVGPAAGLRVAGPGREAEGTSTLTEEGGGVLWRSPALGPPGVYQVRRGTRVVHAVAAAVPAEESDLRPLDPAVLQGRLAGGRAVHFRAAGGGEQGQDDLWVWLAVGCVVCVCGELALLKLFRT
jgi:hypothetical protein